jgi:hypothetical protein
MLRRKIAAKIDSDDGTIAMAQLVRQLLKVDQRIFGLDAKVAHTLTARGDDDGGGAAAFDPSTCRGRQTTHQGGRNRHH